MLEDVSGDPDGYYEVLRPWQNYPDQRPPRDWEVFQKQFERWQNFRRWQQDNRGTYDEKNAFSAFVEEKKRNVGMLFPETESQYLEDLRRSYNRRQRRLGIDYRGEGFAAYVEEDKQYHLTAGKPWPGMTGDEYLRMLRDQFKKKQAEKGIDDVDDDTGERFSAFVEEEKCRDLVAGRKWPGMTEDEYLGMLKSQFRQKQNSHYRRNFYWLREDHGRGGFPEYIKEAKRRLARHGFIRTFQFEEDPTRQDGLTTWIEYLNYEYSRYDDYNRRVEKLQPGHDEAWKRLVESGALRPGETEEYLLTDESSLLRQSELIRAQEALNAVEADAKAILIEYEEVNKGRGKLGRAECFRKMTSISSRFAPAREALKAAEKRNPITQFIMETGEYMNAKHDVYRHSVLLSWVLEQVPLVEAEIAEAKVTEPRSTPDMADAPALQHTAQAASSPQPTKDTSRKTQGGRITKNTSRRQGCGRNGARPQRLTPPSD